MDRQVDRLNMDKQEYMMYVVEWFKYHDVDKLG
jgi:hypothetical protein